MRLVSQKRGGSLIQELFYGAYPKERKTTSAAGSGNLDVLKMFWRPARSGKLGCLCLRYALQQAIKRTSFSLSGMEIY